MYEEYLEDYVYKLMSKVGSRICYMFKPKRGEKRNTSLDKNLPAATTISEKKDNKNEMNTVIGENNESDIREKSDDSSALLVSKKTGESTEKCDANDEKYLNDDDLNNINFHLMLFFMWMIVTILNVPALLTWARNFKYSIVLSPDTSYDSGFIMSICSFVTWQISGPKKHLRHYDTVSALLFKTAVLILALGPFSLTIVSYCVVFMFAIITMQQFFDIEDVVEENMSEKPAVNSDDKSHTNIESSDNEDVNTSETMPTTSDTIDNENSKKSDKEIKEETVNGCDVCDESRIYNVFKNFRDKLSFSNDL